MTKIVFLIGFFFNRIMGLVKIDRLSLAFVSFGGPGGSLGGGPGGIYKDFRC